MEGGLTGLGSGLLGLGGAVGVTLDGLALDLDSFFVEFESCELFRLS